MEKTEAKILCGFALTLPGCGGSAPAPEVNVADQQKVQDMLNKGKKFSEIKKDLYGADPSDPKKSAKKKTRSK
jgi:hypothetical protein